MWSRPNLHGCSATQCLVKTCPLSITSILAESSCIRHCLLELSCWLSLGFENSFLLAIIISQFYHFLKKTWQELKETSQRVSGENKLYKSWLKVMLYCKADQPAFWNQNYCHISKPDLFNPKSQLFWVNRFQRQVEYVQI
jgi:hypothetical protein